MQNREKFACMERQPGFKLHLTGGQTANTYVKFACASGHNNAENPEICNDAVRTIILIKKMETQDQILKILGGNSTYIGLSYNTKNGPLQTHETESLKSLNWNVFQLP